MGLPPEYWRERAERVRKTVDFVNEKARETLLRIAGDYESRARQTKDRL
jgi:hypothetical protein